MKRQIPNIITLLNLSCGFFALMQISEGMLFNAALLVLLGAFFDFFDGLSARLLKVQSPVGAELDSLADVVTFGLVPAFVAFSYLELLDSPVAIIAILIALLSAYRLAKFNVDDRQTESFIGLPTPANALFWISIPLMHWQVSNLDSLPFSLSVFNFINQEYVLIALIILLSVALIAEVPLLSLKFKSLKFKENKSRFLLLLISIVLIALFYFAAIPIIILLYFLISIIDNRTKGHEIQS